MLFIKQNENQRPREQHRSYYQEGSLIQDSLNLSVTERERETEPGTVALDTLAPLTPPLGRAAVSARGWLCHFWVLQTSILSRVIYAYF